MKSEVMLITPIQAKDWLENKNHNRKLNPRHVRDLANEMKSGRWRLTHQGIAFVEEGKLLDGQHRLAAVVESGLAINMQVTFGVPVGEFTIIDRGMRRNMAVITGIPKFAAECYTFMIRISQKEAAKPSPDDVFQLHKYYSDIALSLQDACNTATQFYSSAPIRTAAIVSIALGENKAYVEKTYRDLVLQNLHSLPRVALALVKIYNRGNLTAFRGNKSSQETTRVERYIRARYMFAKSNATFDKMKIGDNDYDQYLKDVTDLVKTALRLSPNQERSQLLQLLTEKDEDIRKIQKKLMTKTAADIEREQIKLSEEAQG